MKINRKKLKLLLSVIWIAFLVGCTMSYEGCSDGYDGDRDIEQMQKDINDGRNVQEEKDITLAEGEILKVRLYYGKDTAEKHAWYKVKLTNERNGWYDYVEYTAYHGFGTSQNNYNDYTFTATNFNKQLTDEHYDPDTAEGIYKMTITGSNGHYVERELYWRNGWNLNSPVMAFNVP